jgi:acyl-CoA synthetase (AMP-forming)/AMP-acid ligase II
MPPANANIARHLTAMAAARPAAPALKIPRGRTGSGEIDYLTLTFAELDAEVTAWTAKLAARGVRRGDRTLLMVKAGLPLIAAAFALFRMGAVPVIIDPGMGLKSFLRCVERTQPRALVGIPLAQILGRVFRGRFRSVQVRVAVSGSMTARLAPVERGLPARWPASGPGTTAAATTVAAENLATDVAAVLFTSGSTGAPKGVVYEHGMFEAQVDLIRSCYDIRPGEIDLPMLPIFALFNPALGMTTVVPEIDPRHPSRADPAKIVQAIRQESATNSFGSPTLWRIVADYCEREKITLPSLRRVLSAGAPVPESLWAAAPRFLTGGELHSPYGATEALPIASISATERRARSTLIGTGGGSPLGRPVPGAAVKIIAIQEGPLATISDAVEVPAGEVGEILVSGPMVTRSYDQLPEATAAAKVPDPAAGRLWHRMGDCGYQDESGMLWFCGRTVERVQTPGGTLHTEPCEAPFRAHPWVKRCALIGLGPPGAQVPALVVEADLPDARDEHTLAEELRALGRNHPFASAIRSFYFHSPFPVDVRHNAKIHRLSLAKWAARNQPVETKD